jgi:hypothetical protein
MTTRANITVDITTPRTKTDKTAVAILGALRGQGWVISADVRQTILAFGADPKRTIDAVKALRNMGFPIATVRGRQNSRYRLYADPAEMEAWRQQLLDDSYSMFVTTTRSLAGAVAAAPSDPMLVAAHAASEGAAIQVGRAKGLPLTQIVADLVPI